MLVEIGLRAQQNVPFFGLRRVHRSKEASRLGFASPRRITEGIKLIRYRIVDTLVETFVGRWRCHVGRNSLAGFRQIITATWQHESIHWLTILPATTKVSVPITERAVDIVSEDAARQA